MMKIEVRRAAENGLSRQVWGFDVSPRHSGEIAIRLGRYAIEARKKPAGRFCAAGPEGRWDSCDERQYHSRLPRPTFIPQDVMDEALDSIKYSFFIGWCDEGSRYTPPKDAEALELPDITITSLPPMIEPSP
ncbi:hypothetical protein [Sphingobium sp. BS19]|uniref:hypothetical protein n=1 Tax=Sphingobium sp. BS19 TaxID=3018973 RepID=UPI0024924EBE|nr:hypothetical protein [Sphingobium sp. BS19]